MAQIDFTPEQRQAIDRREGPLLLAANAGSGKTSVLVERYVAMVMQDDIAPGAILAVTFTDRAAGEMRDRIRRRLIAEGGHDHVAAAEAAWISTLHGFCTRVLKQHALAAGIDPTFRQLDDGEARELRQHAFRAALTAFTARGDDHLELVAAFGPDQLQAEIEGVYDLLRTKGQRAPRLPDPGSHPGADPAELQATIAPATAYIATLKELKTHSKALAFVHQVERSLAAGGSTVHLLKAVKPSTNALKEGAYPDFHNAYCAYVSAWADAKGAVAIAKLDELLAGFAVQYDAAKRRVGAIDYSDLELLTRDLFAENPGLLASYRDRFERVMVDEFQDINALQLELLNMLDRGHTFVVGDEFQSIYGFRHADVEVFRARREQLSAEGAALVLPDNFRSHPELLGAINGAFTDRFGSGYEPLRGGQTNNEHHGPRIELLVTDSGMEFDHDDDDRDLGWRGQEAQLIASRVAAVLADGPYRPRDVAVLLRAASDMHVFERALEMRGIPTLASGGRGFWARRQIRDLLAFLASVANPHDELEFFALLASPLVGLSSTGLVQIGDATRNRSRWDVIERHDDLLTTLSPADAARVAAFRAWFGPLRRRAAQMSIGGLIGYAITDLGYDMHVLALPAGRRRLANLFKLQRLATQYETANGRDIRGFVDRARAELEAEAHEPEAPIEIGDADAVQLMTMHAAKGLEFPVVVCADLGRPMRGRTGRIVVDGDRVGLKLPAVTGDAIETLEFEALNAEAKARDQAEEDRVLYVALTRAEELLIVSGGEKLANWKAPTPGCISIRWVAPALVQELHEQLDQPRSALVGSAGSPIALSVLRREWSDVLLRASDADPQGSLNINVAGPPPAPEPVTPPALPPAGVPSRISYSSLADYSRCGYRYYLRRVLRLPEVDPGDLLDAVPTPSGLDPRLRGSIVHELLEDVDVTAPVVPGAEAVRGARAALGAEEELDDAAVSDCLQLVATALSSSLMARLAGADSAANERGFTFGLGDVLVNGFVDVIAWEGRHAFVIDYKTDAVGPEDDLEAHVAADYAHQRAIYALAALRAGADSVEVVHWFLNRAEEPVSAAFDRGHIDDLEGVVAAAATGLLAGEFAPSDTPHRALCADCPGRAALCSWDEHMTGRELG